MKIISDLTRPDSSYSFHKPVIVPSDAGEIPVIMGPNVNSEGAMILKVKLDDFDRALGSHVALKKGGRGSDSDVLSEYRLDKQFKDGAGLTMPAVFPLGFFERARFDNTLLGQDGHQDDSSQEKLEIYDTGLLNFMRERNAEFIPVYVSGTNDEVAKVAMLLGATEVEPLKSEDLMQYGDDVHSVLSDSDRTLKLPIDELAGMAHARGVAFYPHRMEEYRRDLESLERQREAGHLDDATYDWKKRELDEKRDRNAQMYGGFAQTHALASLLVAHGVETVSLQKFYDSSHTLVDVSQQLNDLEEFDLSAIDDPLDLVSRYEHLVAFNPQEVAGKYGSVTLDPENDDARQAVRIALAHAIQNDVEASTYAQLILTEDQKDRLQRDVETVLPSLELNG